MAFYSTQCEACTDPSKRCVKPASGDAEAPLPEMYECDNETCKLNAARQKGIRQLQSLRAEEHLNHERELVRRAMRHEAAAEHRGRREHRRK